MQETLPLKKTKIDEEYTTKSLISENGERGIIRKKHPITGITYKIERKRNLNGEIDKQITQIGDGSIIVLFDKTTHPEKSTDVVCPHFIELKWANGCPFDCAWCYLKGTFRYFERGKDPYIKNMNKIKKHVKTFLDVVNHKKYVLNTGELSDSLLSEDKDEPLSRWIIPMFEEHNPHGHKVLFLSKSNRVENILDISNHENTIMSFSLNAEKVAEKWEHTPSPAKRIEAARKVYEADYETRLRIDPMVPVKGWMQGYKGLVDKIFKNLEPERITLGSLRGLRSTINNVEDKSWIKYLADKSSWGKKIAFNERLSMYSVIKNYLKEEYNFEKIALCKETKEIWNRLDMNYKNIKCNCVL